MSTITRIITRILFWVLCVSICLALDLDRTHENVASSSGRSEPSSAKEDHSSRNSDSLAVDIVSEKREHALICLKFHKTGGTTLQELLYNVASSDEYAGEKPVMWMRDEAKSLGNLPADATKYWIYMDDDVNTNYHNNGLAAIVAHMIKPPIVFCVLRDPVERALSNYMYLSVTYGGKLFPKAAQELTIDDFDDMEDKYGIHGRLLDYIRVFDIHADLGGTGQGDVAHAITRAEADGVVFGLSEEMDKSIVLLALLMKWDVRAVASYKSYRKLLDKPDSADMPADVRAWLDAELAVDIEFYKYAADKFYASLETNAALFAGMWDTFIAIRRDTADDCTYKFQYVNKGNEDDSRTMIDCIPTGFSVWHVVTAYDADITLAVGGIVLACIFFCRWVCKHLPKDNDRYSWNQF